MKIENIEKEKEERENFMRKVRKNVREIRKPYVMKDKNGNLFIIYEKRVEFYKLQKIETKKQIDEENADNCNYDYEEIYGKGWNKEHEFEMNKNNGFKLVGLKDE